MVNPVDLKGQWSTIESFFLRFINNSQGTTLEEVKGLNSCYSADLASFDLIFTDQTKTCLVSDYAQVIHTLLVTQMKAKATNTTYPARIPSIVRAFELKYISEPECVYRPIEDGGLAAALNEAVERGETHVTIYIESDKIHFDGRVTSIDYRNFDHLSLIEFPPVLPTIDSSLKATYKAGYEDGYMAGYKAGSGKPVTIEEEVENHRPLLHARTSDSDDDSDSPPTRQAKKQRNSK